MTSTAMRMPTTQQKRPSLNPALKPFWQTKADLKILKGGRASSKTWDAAGFAIYLARTYRVKFLCMRQFQNKIQESVYAVLKVQIERFGLSSEFEILKSTIRHRKTKSEFHFYGIHRNIAEIKGFEGADIGWIEEGEGLTQEQWKHIEPTLRKEGAECWLLYNPRLQNDFVETLQDKESLEFDPRTKLYKTADKSVLVRHINYDENPFLSATMLRKINRLKRLDYDEYEHIYLGIAITDDDHVIIKMSWLEAAVDAHIKLGIEPKGKKRIGFDIADDGPDLCSQVYRHGIVALWGENWKGKEDEILKSCTRVFNKAIELGASINYDSIGVGASAGGKFSDLNDAREEAGLAGRVRYSKFVAGGGVVDPDGFYIETDDEQVANKDFFCNLKTQAWWGVGDLFRNTYNAVTHGEKFEEDELISISSDMPGLKNLLVQLSTVRRDFSKTGQVKAEGKDDLAKRGVNSPNDADAFIMAYAPEEAESIGFLDF